MAEGSGTFAYRALGTMCASLQAHGRSWEPPESGKLRTWDEVFYYQDFDPVVIDNPKYGHLFDARRISKITQAATIAESVIHESYEIGSPQVVHGDLHEWNVHIAGGRLYAFDFEDVMLALPAQDAAICLYSSRTSDMTDDIRAAFRKGYEALLPWPIVDERQLDGFHAARQVMLMNYAARTLPVSEAEDYLDGVWPWMERYLDRYG
jgi:Ser/Thr protein kinase RdoA (MazF antagonist)